MTVAHHTSGGGSDHAPGGPIWQFSEWFFGIVGGIAAFLGLFILFAGEDQYVGLGGDWSWRVGEISTAWTYGLLIGGGVLLLAAIVMVIMGRGRTAEDQGADSAAVGLFWHAGVFLAVNAFIWAQDIAIGEGLNYAHWITIPWAVGLTVHALMYFYARGRADEV